MNQTEQQRRVLHGGGKMPIITITSPLDNDTVAENFTATGSVSSDGASITAAVTDNSVPPNILAVGQPTPQQGPDFSFQFTNVPTGPCWLRVKTTNPSGESTIHITVQ
jgi:hypothetical protein